MRVTLGYTRAIGSVEPSRSGRFEACAAQLRERGSGRPGGTVVVTSGGSTASESLRPLALTVSGRDPVQFVRSFSRTRLMMNCPRALGVQGVDL